MNKNIEDILKEALENHDAGYVSGAWESMSARLDGTAPTPFYKKWWVAAAFGTVLVGTAAFFMLHETHSAEKSIVNQTQKVQSTSTSSTSASNKSNSIHVPLNNSTMTLNSEENKNSSDEIRPSGSQVIAGSFHYDENGNYVHQNPAIVQTNKNTEERIANTEKPANTDYKAIVLPASICLNEEVSITNPNDNKSIVVIEPSGRRVEIAAKKNLSFNAKNAGTITVQSGDHSDYIIVHENKTDLYIDVDPSLLYENGIPTLKFKVTGSTNNLVWNSNIKGNEIKGDTYIVHPYTERSVEEKQVVTLNEQYNLLAPTAFDPMNSDIRNKTFMPYALTQRSVMFEMMIIDPRTGAVVYSTSDSNEGWTGIDQRTGEYVKSGSVWPWRVLIKNPNTGEPREYSGTITKL